MSNRAKTILLLLADILLLFLCLMAIVLLREESSKTETFLSQHFILFTFIFPFWISIYFIEGLYTLKTYNPANLAISLLRGTFLSVLVSFIAFYWIPFQFSKISPKTNLILIAMVALPLLWGWRRFFFKFFAQQNRQRGTVLIGSSSTLKQAVEKLQNNPYLGYRIIAALTPKQASTFSPTSEVKLVAIERNVTKDPDLYNKYFSLLGSEVEVMDLAKFAERISGKIPLAAIDESWFIEYCGHTESRSYDALKSVIDRLIAVILILLVFPIYILLLPLLLIFHGRPIFFKQMRTGLNNRPFVLYKLRTMVVNAEKSGVQWSIPGDSRITSFGRFLRRTRIDELPQLLNILKGEMSLVGPRPERPEMIESTLAPEIPFYKLRHLVKPGVTGWAQVVYRYGYSTEDSAEKLQYDLFYVKNKSLWLDIIVIIKTIKTVLTAAGQ